MSGEAAKPADIPDDIYISAAAVAVMLPPCRSIEETGDVISRIARAILAEREQCAKLAEGWECEAAGDIYQTCGNGRFWDPGTNYDQGRIDVAAAIRGQGQ